MSMKNNTTTRGPNGEFQAPEYRRIAGRRKVVLEEAEYERLRQKADEWEPSLPAPLPDGNYPAVEYLTASLARKIIRQVVDDLRRRLSSDVRPVLWGRLDRTRRTRMRAAKNLDFRATVRANLQHWDVERKKLLARDLWFRSRVKRHLPWTIIIAVDCSGSMLDSVIHSAVMAGIFAGLPAVRVKLLAFDTSVVDLSDAAVNHLVARALASIPHR